MSGQLAGGVVGGVIGFFASGGNPYGAYLGWTIGSAVGGMLKPEELPGVQGPRLQDLRAQTSEYGRPIPIVYGVAGLSGNVIWASDIVELSHTESQGGKGGGPSQDVTTFSYYGNFAVLVCEGEIDAITRIWAGPDKRLIYDTRSTNAGSTLEGGSIRIYLGSETQTADPLIESYEGAGNVPAFRGYAYVVFDMFPLAKDRNVIPFLTFEVRKTATRVSTVVDVATLSGAQYATTFGYPSGNIAFAPDGSLWARRYGNGFHDIARINPYTGDILDSFTLPSSNGNVMLGFAANGKVWLKDTFASLALYTWTPGTTDQTRVSNPYISGGLNIRFTTGARTVGNNLWYWDGDGFGTDFVACASAETNTIVTTVTADQLGGTGVDLDSDGEFVYAVSTTKIYKIQVAGSIATVLTSVSETGITSITYHDGYVYTFTTGDVLQKRDTSTLAVVASLSSVGGSGANNYLMIGPSGTGVTGNNSASTTAREIDLQTMTVLTDITGTADTGTFTGPNTNITRDPTSGRLMKVYSVGTTYYLQSFNTGRYQDATLVLSDVVLDLCQRAGLSVGQINVTALTDEVDGYTIARQTSVRSAIEPLQQAYYFDSVESDGAVKFVKRGGSSIVTVPSTDLGTRMDGEGDNSPIESTRRMENELPNALNVNYQLAASDYESSTKLARRLIGASEEQTTLELPLVLSDTKAQEIAEVNLFAAWAGRITYSFSLPKKYAYIEPTDVITAGNRLLRLTNVVETPGGVLKCQAQSEESGAYAPSVLVTETPDSDKTVSVSPLTRIEYLDSPIFRDEDDNPGFYVAACGYQTGWIGAILFKSNDGGAGYTQVAAITNAATIGNATTALGNWVGHNMFDESNTVTVFLVNGSLSSITELAVLNGANAAVLGSEVIQFKTATLNADGTYTLSGLLRGRRGTEWAMSSHAVGDRFVLLEASKLVRVSASTAEIGLERLYKAVGIGSSLDKTFPRAFTNTAVGLECFSPVLIGGGRNAALDITINWVRRTRIGGEWRSNVDAPLGETSESYEVEIYDSSYTTLKRTITGLSSATTTYTAAQQTTDFGGTQSTVYVKIYQLSANVGRGYAGTGTV